MANTITKTYRYGLELGAKAKVGADFKLISIELEGSITQDQEWVDSNVTAVTRKQTWTLKQGQICAPMTVQIKTECQSQINIASFAVYGKDGARKHPGIDNVCTYFASEAERDNYVRGQGIDAATVAQICTSTMPTNNEGRIVLDVNEPGLRFPQSYTGCGLS